MRIAYLPLSDALLKRMVKLGTMLQIKMLKNCCNFPRLRIRLSSRFVMLEKVPVPYQRDSY